jgi:hypothetical protein
VADILQSTVSLAVPLIFVLILSSHQHPLLQNELFLSGFLIKMLYASLSSPVCANMFHPTQLPIMITLQEWKEERAVINVETTGTFFPRS